MNGLFVSQDETKPAKFCRTCAHRQRWECESKVIQYRGKRKSNRTFNGLLKIKVTNNACELYEEESKYKNNNYGTNSNNNRTE